jgi:hypothetical protein
MDWKIKTANIKTTLSGIVGYLLAFPVFLNALYDWAAHKPVDWRFVIVSCAVAAVSHGLVNAKDDTTHSTQAQVTAASSEVKAAVAVAKADDAAKT